jgi:hypothetical protein
VKNVFDEFVSIFLRKLPDRFALLVLVISIISLGSFAYEHVGLPIQIASAQVTPENANATSVAVSWLSMQPCFGDRVLLDTVNTTILSADGGTSHMTVDFESMIYRVDQVTGGLHHSVESHSVDVIVQNGSVVSAVENMRDLMNSPIVSPMSAVSQEYS